jgi:hypothetical protein
MFNTITVAQCAILPKNHPVMRYWKKTDKIRKRLYEEYLAKRREAHNASGLFSAERKSDKCSSNCWRIGKKALRIRAATAEGMMVKVRIVEHIAAGDRDDEINSMGFASLAKDIAALKNLQVVSL